MAFESTVADIRLLSREGGGAASGTWQMSLDRTDFVPGDRGLLEAVTRTGTRLRIAVSGVLRDEADVVWHLVDKPLAAGTDVLGTVDHRIADGS